MMAVLVQLTTYFYQVLSPLQRYQSMRRLKSNPMQNDLFSRWYVIAGFGLIGVLLIVLFVYRRVRLEKELLARETQFRESCDRRQLTGQEREILSSICRHAQLEIKSMIFSDIAAFEDGFAALVQESFLAGHSLKQRKHLNIMIQCIKAKLGFQKSAPTYNGAAAPSEKMSSRQIPEGRRVRVEVVSESSVSCFEADVMRNDSFELIVQPEMAIEATPGQTAHIQYQTGAIIWMFESTIIACGPGGLELNHNEDMKFLNRRRFPRVAVQKKARVALYEANQVCVDGLKDPVFEDAVVTELSGCGLMIRTDLNLKIRGRILVIFELQSGRLIQDIAEVRGLRETQSGRLAAVEMIGLNENTVNDLMHITQLTAKTAGTLLCDPQPEAQPDVLQQAETVGVARE